MLSISQQMIVDWTTMNLFYIIYRFLNHKDKSAQFYNCSVLKKKSIILRLCEQFA